MLSTIAVKSFKSRHPVTSTASDPSVVRRPWASTSRRNLRGKVAQHVQFGETPPQLALSQQISHRQRPHPAKGIAHGRNATLPRRSQQRPQHRRKHVRVLVGVEVRRPHSRRLQALDLRAGLSFDLGGVELVAERSYDKVVQLDAKLAAAVLRARLQQAGDSVRRQERFAVEQHHVAAHAEACVARQPASAPGWPLLRRLARSPSASPRSQSRALAPRRWRGSLPRSNRNRRH